MTKYFLIIALSFVSGDIYAKSIYKCKKENGTLSYQEEPCVADNRTIKEKIVQRQNGGSLNNPTETEIVDFFEKNIDAFSIDLKTYNISVLKSKNWRVFNKVLGDDMLHLKYKAEDLGSEISLLMDFTLVQNNKTFDQAELNKVLKQMGQKFLASSVQDAVHSENMDINNGIGVVSVFTDKNLVNKSSYPPGEYLHTIKGLIYKNNFFIHFTLLTNDIESMNNIIALQSLSSGIRIDKLVSSTKSSKTSDPVDVAYAAYLQGNIRESVALFENAIDKDPKMAFAWLGYCISLIDTNRLQAAFIACDNALSLSPEDANIYSYIVDLLIRARDWEQALNFSKKMSQIATNEVFINAINNQGYHAMVVGELAIAEQSFSLVEKLDGISNKLVIDLAVLNYVKGNKAESIKTIKELLSRDTEHEDYLNSILKTINADLDLFGPNTFQESYVLIPKRLRKIGEGKNNQQKPDEWVTKLFPLQGVGLIQVDVPEEWFEMTEIASTDKGNNEIAIKLTNEALDKIVITLNISKVDEGWDLGSLKQQMLSNISIFFDINENQIETLNNNTLYFKKHGIKKDGLPFNMEFKYEINKNIVSKILVLDSTTNNIETVNNILNSFRINNPDYSQLNLVTKPINKSPITSKNPANETELPNPPKGFSWVRMPEIMAAFLKPDGWFETNRKTKDSHTFALSKESVKVNGSFDTGLTVIAIDNVMDKYNFPPYTVSLQMFEDIKENTSNTIIGAKDISQGPFKSFFVKYENNPDVAVPVIIHKVFISNDKTGSLYIISFESLKSNWDEAWKNGDTILKYYLVDDEF